MKIYYLTLEGISSTVFESQVRSLIKNINKSGKKIELIIGQKMFARISFGKFLSLFFSKHIKFIFIHKQVDYNKLADIFIKRNKVSSPIILHCRNIEAAYVGLLIKQKLLESNTSVNLIYDVRGFVEGEKVFFNENKIAKAFESLNDRLFTSDIYFNFVSEELYTLYNKKYRIPLEKTIFCNSAYDDTIFRVPNTELNQQNEKVKVLFVGGNQKYQKIQEIIAILNDKKDVRLTVVTPRKLTFSNQFKNIEYLTNLTQQEINNLANDYDYGIIYRSDELFNQVATPTKVAEYLGKGLKVIAINSAGAYSKTLSTNNLLGVLLPSEAELKNLRLEKVSQKEKQEISLFAKKNYSLTRNVGEYIELYEKISKTL